MSKALFGSCDPTTLAANAPDVDLGEFAEVKLEQVHIYSALFEIPLHGAMRSLPVGVHPSIPALSCATFWRCPGGPLGAFELAFIGLACRTGIKPRQLVYSAFADTDAACGFFRQRYGFPCRSAKVRQREYYDRVLGSVEMLGKRILEISTTGLTPLVGMGSFVKYSAALNFARVPEGVGLVQLEASYEFTRVIRGVPQAVTYDGAALGDATIVPVYPVSGAHAIVNLTLHPTRFVVDPVTPAERGGVRRIERGNAARA